MIKVEQVIDWQPIEKILTKAYRLIHNAAGEPRSLQRRVAYPALPMFKAILLQRWYRLSDPGLEEALYES